MFFKERTYDFTLEGLALALTDKPSIKRFLEDNEGIDTILTIAIIISSAAVVSPLQPVSLGYIYKATCIKSLALNLLSHF